MMMSKEDKKRDREYREEDDLRTLVRAQEVRGDKSRMVGVRRQQRRAARAVRSSGRAIGRRV